MGKLPGNEKFEAAFATGGTEDEFDDDIEAKLSVFSPGFASKTGRVSMGRASLGRFSLSAEFCAQDILPPGTSTHSGLVLS